MSQPPSPAPAPAPAPRDEDPPKFSIPPRRSHTFPEQPYQQQDDSSQPARAPSWPREPPQPTYPPSSGYNPYMMPYSVPHYPVPQSTAAYPPVSGPHGPGRAAQHAHFEPYNEDIQSAQQGPSPVPLVAPYDTWATPPGGFYGPGDTFSRPAYQPVRRNLRRSASPTPASSPTGHNQKRRHKTVKFEKDSDDGVLDDIDEYSPVPLSREQMKQKIQKLQKIQRQLADTAKTLSQHEEHDDSDQDGSDESRSNSTVDGAYRSIRGASTVRSYGSSKFRTTPALVTEESGSSAYSFAASFRAARAASIGGSADGEQSEDVDVTPSQPLPKDDQNPEVAHILASSYTGEGYTAAEGHHSADLLMAANPAQLRHLQPLYRWMHLTRPSMSLEDLSNQIARLSVLTGTERKAVNDILFRLKQSSVKLIQTLSGKPVQHMEPGCFDYALPHDSGVGGKTRTTRGVTWLCLPYFSLEPYSGLLSGTENSSMFPIQTLLQAQFSRAAKERDMQQAVRQVAKAGPGLCFHISQLWCIIINNTFVITYGRMSEDVLRGNSITKLVKAVSSLSEEQSQQKFWIRFGGNVMWTLAVKDCMTWFDFVSHFWEFWHLPLCFYRNKRLVSPEDWPKIWASASQKHSHTISFDLELGPTPKLPTPGRLVPIEPQSQQTEATETDEPKNSKATSSKKETVDDKARRTKDLRPPTPKSTTTPSSPKASEQHPTSSFALFTCLDDVPLSTEKSIDEAKLDERLNEIETILLHETSVSDQRAYKRCPTSNRLSIYHMLQKEELEIVHPEKRIRSSNPQDYEIRADIFNLADMIFRFFLPVTTETPMASKFWGAVDNQVKQNDEGVADDRYQLRAVLKELAGMILYFTETFVHAQHADRVQIHVPDQLIDGWLHLLLGLSYMSSDPERASSFLDFHAKPLISQGLNAIVKDMAKKPLFEKSIILPQELVSLMSMKLLTDVTPGLPNISQTYSAYLSAIEADITGKQSDRSHEQRLDLLDQELSVVQSTLRSQRDIFERLERYSQQSAYKMPASARSRVGVIPVPPNAGYYSGAPRNAPGMVPNMHRQYDHGYDQGRLKSAHGYGKQGYGHYPEPPPFYVEDVSGSMADESKQLSARDPGGFRQLFLNECILQLDQREREFEEYELHSNHLRVMNRNKVDVKKDRQERLIYAFTVVTIIFLPLSAVSSIFGMNTSDIRDMEVGQWAYWAVAIPVTAAVLFLGFLFTGDLGAVFRWVSRFSGHGMSALPGASFQGELPSLSVGEKWRMEKRAHMGLGSGPGKDNYGSESEYGMPRRSENLRRRSSYTPYEREKWGLPY
ncbi:hypothetical protein SMACR_00715 [Sordaria macrospora]|uniref:WGS project CABT00000000 data, contig 2.2 n=2 Tax=Sordaria macrospora TaxID=5147 RepID=F7VMW0_SORMK|nr:uncharacterized protein SMAC_00715 [Sordaria macrospora k-hell]KAA8633941.1 hypothetical protein SMACR_00715 [Sordaria macrospora]WPJ66826.1 hypothetical protein SMAC4_00715 [Sordaria macrospora]CCC06689.1 unnamed protein product [Sordaria macrospora k-hell]